MGIISKKLEPIKLAIKYKLRWRYTRKEWFLGRHACLGYDSLKLLPNTPKEINFQKGRVDLLLSILDSPNVKPKTSLLQEVMHRNDVLPLIKQLEFLDVLPRKAPKFIFIDSFAELTDQLFQHKSERWLFACAYSDVNHSDDFESGFESFGLLPLQFLEEHYSRLFHEFEARWGVVPILFLHFPITLEGRQLYIERYHAIANVIKKLSDRYKNLHSIQIDESEVSWPDCRSEELKNFPYHYDDNTYEKFKIELLKTGLFD